MSRLSYQCHRVKVKVIMSGLSCHGYKVKGPLVSLADSRLIVFSPSLFAKEPSFRHVCHFAMCHFLFLCRFAFFCHIVILPFCHFCHLVFLTIYRCGILSLYRLRSREEQERRGLRARRCLAPSRQGGITVPSTGNC